MKKLLYIIGMVFCGVLTSCSEDEGTAEEYAEWQTKNETYWSTLYSSTLQKIANGSTTVDTIRVWSKQNQTPAAGATLSYGPEDYIIVEKKTAGTGTELPQFSDSVAVHYEGRLIPSTTYTAGYVFDKSWTGDYNLQTMKASVLSISGVVDGFATALLSMHEGDRWTVYMPYQLGYGTSTSSSSIPAYSTLIFDLTLSKIYKVGRK